MAKEKEMEAQLSKLDAKREKAVAKKEELNKQIEELKEKILTENDEKAKQKLRKQRDELIAEKDSIVIGKDKVKIPMAASAKRKLTACIAVVCIIALLFAYVATGAARHGFISSLGWPQKAFVGMTVTDNDGKKHGVKVSTYNYYFAVYYNNVKQQQSYLSQLGGLLSGSTSDDQIDFDKPLSKQTTKDDDGNEITWAKKVEDTVLDNIKHTYGYYYAALKANDGKEPEITEDQQKEMDELLDTYKGYADEYGFTLSAYLMAAMGDGVDAETVKHEMKVSYIAENYEADTAEELSKKEYSEDEYNKYLEENRADLVSVDVRFFEASNEDDAKAFVAELADDGSNFTDLAVKYAEDEDKETYKDAVESTYNNATRSVFTALNAAIAAAQEAESTEESGEESEEHEHVYPGFDWLYSEDRKAGDKTNFSTSVVYVVKPVNLSEVKTINVRHILIQAETTDDDGETSELSSLSSATDEEIAAAEAKAKEVLDEYNNGEKTEDAFAELAKTYSKDGNASTGGLYENVVPNQMVPTFNAWCFDASRKVGDVAIVKTEYGFHVMYFSGTNDMPVWKYTAQQALVSEEGTDAEEKFEESIKIKKSWPGSCYFQKDTDIDN